MPDRSSRLARAGNTDDPSAHGARCSACEAVCCRLTVLLEPDDRIPAHLTTRLPQGHQVMARAEDGWCVALDRTRMNCGIYESRPGACRRFAMDGPHCNAVREDYARDKSRGIDTPPK